MYGQLEGDERPSNSAVPKSDSCDLRSDHELQVDAFNMKSVFASPCPVSVEQDSNIGDIQVENNGNLSDSSESKEDNLQVPQSNLESNNCGIVPILLDQRASTPEIMIEGHQDIVDNGPLSNDTDDMLCGPTPQTSTGESCYSFEKPPGNPFRNFPTRRKAIKIKKNLNRHSSLPEALIKRELIKIVQKTRSYDCHTQHADSAVGNGNEDNLLSDAVDGPYDPNATQSADSSHKLEVIDRMYSEGIFTFDFFRIQKLKSLSKQYENTYRGLLRCLLHPLGAPDQTPGLRPGDLIDHICRVFDVNREDHEMIIREELHQKWQFLRLNVNVIEARDLKVDDDVRDTMAPYCLLTVVHPGKWGSPRNSPILSGSESPRLSPRVSPKVSPKVSPRVSPYGSPIAGRAQEQLVFSTAPCTGSSVVHWLEEFSLEIQDFLADELHVYVCDQEHLATREQHAEKHTLKNLFSFLRHSTEQEKLANFGCLGKIVIPIRNIPVLGSDGWHNIIGLASSWTKPKTMGSCRLGLEITYRKDIGDENNISIDDYRHTFRQFLTHSMKAQLRREGDDSGGGILSTKDRRILQMFAGAHGISKLSQAIVHVCCLLEICTAEGGEEVEGGEATLRKLLEDLRMTWAATRTGDKKLEERLHPTVTEIFLFRKEAVKYIHLLCSKVDELPPLFPPSVESTNNLKLKLGIGIQLLSLDFWEMSCPTQKELSNKLLQRLQADVSTWFSEKLESVGRHEKVVKDKVLPEMTRFADLVDSAASHCSTLGMVKQFYNEFNINYYRITACYLEKGITSKAKELMEAVDKYNKRYNSYNANITSASRLTLRLYFHLRAFCTCVKEHVTRRDVLRLGISKYQSWFSESLTFWLQTFRTETFNRMERALEIDKDVVVATSRVKFSNSSVDVLSCFAKVIDEWRHIDYRDPDWVLMGVTKVTDIICDGVRLYAEKVHLILEKNQYFDSSHNAEFDVTERLCITLNNIEHVRLYLHELPDLLEWEATVVMIATRYCGDDVGDQAERTLNRLVQTANSEIDMKCSLLMWQIAEKMMVEVDRHIELFTSKEPSSPSSVDQFIGYITSNLDTLHSKLMPAMFPRMIGELWGRMLASFDRHIKVGERIEYYTLMKQHLRSIGSYFTRTGLDESNRNCEKYKELKQRLEMHTMKSEDLMLEYLHDVSLNLGTPTEYSGHLALKLAYMEETRGNVTVFVKVIRGSNLPSLDINGLSDPYVVVSLQPKVLFDRNTYQQTRVVSRTLNPVFNTEFQFPNVPKQYFLKKGACVLVSVLDHDRIVRDDFAGEILIQMSSLPSLEMGDSVEKQSALILPLKHPIRPMTGAFQILQERSWDKDAKSFVLERTRYMEKSRRQGQPGNGLSGMFSMFTKLLP